jgi:hypothetical protein
LEEALNGFSTHSQLLGDTIQLLEVGRNSSELFLPINAVLNFQKKRQVASFQVTDAKQSSEHLSATLSPDYAIGNGSYDHTTVSPRVPQILLLFKENALSSGFQELSGLYWTAC